MTIVIRADASPEIGGGHVMRCLTLADVLAERGAQVIFACRPETLPTVPALARSAHRILELADQAADGRGGDEPGALAAAVGESVDVLIVDHYGWGTKQETACRGFARRIVVIDDLADRAHDCDLLLDQNLGRRGEDYTGLVPSHARLLIGPAYALLRPEFARARPAALARREAAFANGEPVRRILVSMGLTDPTNATAAAIDALAGLTDVRAGKIEVRVVLGRGAPHLCAIEAQAVRLRNAGVNITMLIEPQDMAAEMSAADLCVGAGGSSSWERCCLGLPTVVVVVAENQRAGAMALERAGAGHRANLDTISLGGALDDLAGTVSDRRLAMGRSAASLTDGLGARRVACSILPEHDATGADVSLRPAVPEDAEATYRWQLAPGVRRFARTPHVPSRDEHMAWFHRRLATLDGHFCIVCAGRVDCGALRLDAMPQTNEFEISVLVAPEYWRRGIALAAVRVAAFLVVDKPILACVLEGNEASDRLFRAAEFQLEPERTDGQSWYRLSVKNPPANSKMEAVSR